LLPFTRPADPTRSRGAGISRYFVARIGYVVLIVTFFTVFAFQHFYQQGYGLGYSRTVAVNTLVVCELFYLFNCKRIMEPALGKGFFNNKFAFAAVGLLVFFQLLFTYLPIANILFQTAPLPPEGWLIPLAGGLLVFLIVEVEKWTTGMIKKKKEIGNEHRSS
jgi:Ca2+-transporting ATPase